LSAAVSVTLTQLHSFLAVVRGGSVTSAADELVVTQPSVSAAVAALAREVGTPLLQRDGRGVRPTAAGSAFAEYAADVIGLLDEGRRAALQAAKAAERVLRIAAVTTAAESFVPALMRGFSREQPDLRLALSVGNRSEVLDLLVRHRADVAFGGRPPADPRIDARGFLPNELVLVAAPDDPLAAAGPVAPARLRNRTWLLREPASGTRSANEEFLVEHGLEGETLTVGSNGAIRRAARLGLGVSFLSRDAVAGDIEAGALGVITVDPGPTAREWHVMRATVGPPRPLVDAFIAYATSAAARRELTHV
jgi:LysR family transcriptional regulator, low CO2-responsive transcriptional regulator